MLWVKALHIVFVVSWFAGLFYLPRIFVNLAMEREPASVQRLLLMARKLYRFMTMLAVPALVFGLWLYIGYGIGRGPGQGWMHAKLALVLVLIGYHHGCGVLLKKFEGERLSERGDRYIETIIESAISAGQLVDDLLSYSQMGRSTITAEKASTASPGYINAGVYLFSREALDMFPAGPCSLERDMLPALARTGRVESIMTDGGFLDIGLPETYAMAPAFLAAFKSNK